MTTATWHAADLRDLAGEISAIRGQSVPESPGEFWRQLAVENGVTLKTAISENAAGVASALDIAPDDDFFNAEGDQPALSLYEAVLDALQRREKAGLAVDPLEGEVDDDDTTVELQSFTSDVPPQPWTVRETLLRIEEGSLVLNPEWQRGFVWKLQKQRRLIESMLLGLPIPSFLFFEESSSGKIFVIDGRQRLETIYRFCSKKENKGETKVRFKTFNAKVSGWMEGQPLNASANRHYDGLPENMRKKFERAPLVTFTFKDIPSDQLYQIFKRYNTGAVALNAAEIRNAVYQASPLHGMLFRLGGEFRDLDKYLDDDEREVGETLRGTMPKGKLERYGVYDFIGRFFAFRYQHTGSVASATNAFMQKYGKDSSRVDGFRREFISSFRKVLEWYAYPLVEPSEDGSFNAWLATLQLVSTAHALSLIENGGIAEAFVRMQIAAHWPSFAREQLTKKQNSTVFWDSQGRWNAMVVGEA